MPVCRPDCPMVLSVQGLSVVRGSAPANGLCHGMPLQNSRNIAFEAYLIKPESFMGLSCTAFQKREGRRVLLPERGAEPLADQQLQFRCTTGRPNISLASFHIKVPAGAKPQRAAGLSGAGKGPARPVLQCDWHLKPSKGSLQHP